MAARVRRIRNGGQAYRYDHEVAGVNTRLDEMQAAILRARLPCLAGWTLTTTLAVTYRRGLSTPRPRARNTILVTSIICFWCDRPLGTPCSALRGRGIETLVHYPIPIPAQTPSAIGSWGVPTATEACREVLSLPMYPALTDAELEDVVTSVSSFQEG